MRKYYGVESGAKSNFYLDKILADENRVMRLCDKGGTTSFLTGLMTSSEFSVSINNSWQNAGGLSIIDSFIGMANGMARSSAGQILVDKMNSGEGIIGTVGNTVNSIFGSDITGKLKKYQNANFVNATNMVKQYYGTKGDFDIPDMMCLFLVSKSDNTDPRLNIDRDANGKPLIYKFMGSFSPGETIDLSGYTLLAIQNAPNGYEVDYKNILDESAAKGSFDLYIGKHIKLSNIVISSVKLMLSPYSSAKLSGDPDSDEAKLEDAGFPAYLLMNISFEFCKELTPDMMAKIIKGKS